MFLGIKIMHFSRRIEWCLGHRGVRGQKNIFWYFFIFMNMTTCKKPHQKINFLADAILFWKSNFACNYSRHPNFKRKYLKIMFNELYIDNHLLIFSITLSEWSVGLSEKSGVVIWLFWCFTILWPFFERQIAKKYEKWPFLRVFWT